MHRYHALRDFSGHPTDNCVVSSLHFCQEVRQPPQKWVEMAERLQFRVLPFPEPFLRESPDGQNPSAAQSLKTAVDGIS